MVTRIFLLLSFLLVSGFANCQSSIEASVSIWCEIMNPSFEEAGSDSGQFNMTGKSGEFGHLSSWTNCGDVNQSPPTLHTSEDGIFNVKTTASHGDHFLSMVVRDIESVERISQKLIKPLEAQMSYYLELDLAMAAKMKSATTRSQGKELSFDRACILRVYCGMSDCDKAELLTQTSLIEQEDWTRVRLEWSAKQACSHLIFEVFYDIPVLQGYNGNMLIDNLSPIYVIE